MASNVTVELDGEPLKRTSVKTTPNMALKAVAVAACERLKLDGSVDAYRLKYQKNFLDLSLSVRFANLPAGAKLILVRQASSSSSSSSNPAAAAPQPRVQQVSIALQTEEGARLLGKFPNNVSFWAVMRHFEGLDPQLNLTRREAPPPQKDRSGIPKALHAIAEAGRLAAPKVYLQPTIVLMTREFSSIEVLRSTTLMDAGLQTGSSMLRLLYKYTDEPLATFLPQIQAADDAAASASKPQPAAPPAAPSSSSSSSSSSTTPTAAPPPAAARPAPADVRRRRLGQRGRDGRGQPQRRWWWGGKERGCGRAQGAKVVQDWQVIERGNIRLRPSSSRLLPPPSITVRELQHFSPWPLRNKRVQD